jgi:hypothetical protein
MSLVGSLEDLGLGDILQIISLSRKSGVLWIRSPVGEGQVLFRDGLIRGVFARGGPTDLRDLVARQGDLPKADLETAVEEARARVCGLGEVLAERGMVSAEQQDEWLRDHISSSVLTMFTWATGEFSFEISAAAEVSDEELFLEPGVNPQFLALEGTRLQDEGERPEDFDEAPTDHPGLERAFEDSPADGFGPAADFPTGAGSTAFEAPLVEDGSNATEPVFAEAELVDEADLGGEDAVAEAVLVDGEDFGSEPDLAPVGEIESETPPVPDRDEPRETAPTSPVARPAQAARTPLVPPIAQAQPRPPAAASAAPARGAPPVVVIDPDLAVLEWLKGALDVASRRVHIFQRPEQGISRIRQYLARAETPWVLLASDAPADPLSGARDAAEIVRRLKSQAPRMPLFLLDSHGGASVEEDAADTTLSKPTARMLADPRRASEVAALAQALIAALDRNATEPEPAASPVSNLPPDTLARLRELSARLRDPSSQGEVLSLVMRFAAESFSRVAMFMLRDAQAIGMAQVGLPRAGGPDDGSISDVVIPAQEAGWFRRVIESKSPIRGAPADEGDQRLAVLLGNALPSEAYVAPIESGDRVVALLYADNLPDDRPVGDSSALEVVLHEAGLALDRAVLERALAEAERD